MKTTQAKMNEVETMEPATLNLHRAIYHTGCKAYASKGGRLESDSEEYKKRKAAWNRSKTAVLRATDSAEQLHLSKPLADRKGITRAKADGAHIVGFTFKPTEGVLFEALELEKTELTAEARRILATGTKAEGEYFTYEKTLKIAPYILRCVKQDGLCREPLRAHPVQAEILSANEEGEKVVDRAAILRWLDWRNASIQHFRKEKEQAEIEAGEAMMAAVKAAEAAQAA